MPKPGTGDLQALNDIDKIIHEPARLMVLAYLYVVESADFTFLMRETGLTRGNLSSHMSKLENAGYIAVKKEFMNKMPRTLFTLTKAGRTAFRAYKKEMQRVLNGLPD